MRIAILALIFAVASPLPTRPGPCHRERFEGSHFTVCRYDPQRDRLGLVGVGPQAKAPRRMSVVARGLGGEAARVRFAINGGMFDAAGAPVGLYVEAGRLAHPLNTRDGPGNFHLKPNGVFWVGADGAPHVDSAEAFAAEARAPVWATQSGPMLVIGATLHPAIKDDGPSRHIRNGVGVSPDHAALFVISDQPVSFGRLARLFRDRLHCADALYLDGSVSSLWSPALKRMDDSFSLGPVIVVSEK